jgi:small subunit ribosomal protein S17
MEGKVVKRSGDKTVAVEVVTLSTHQLYGKKMKHTKRYLSHDPENKAEVGQVVTIREIRPLSRHKRFMVVFKKETI